jgi:hypothetical protein
MAAAVVWIALCVAWLLLSLSSGGTLPGRQLLLITRLCPIIISAIIFSNTGSRPMALFFPDLQQTFFHR